MFSWQVVKSNNCCKKLSEKERARTATTATEEFSQSIRAPSSMHPGTAFPLRANPSLRCTIYYSACYRMLYHIYNSIYIYIYTFFFFDNVLSQWVGNGPWWVGDGHRPLPDTSRAFVWRTICFSNKCKIMLIVIPQPIINSTSPQAMK